MAVEPVPARALCDACGAIAVDQPCRKCSYNLRGLREDGRCPECGTPVGLSTQGDLLRFADPEWVGKVARGLTIIVWMLFVGFLGGVAGSVLSAFVAPVVGEVTSFAAASVGYYGAWLLTTPDPSGLGEDRTLTARKFVRITLVVSLVGAALHILVVAVPLSAAAELSLIAGGMVAALVGLIGEFAKFIVYERLARRIPDEALAARSRFLRWAYSISLGVVAVGGALAAAGGLSGASSADGLLIAGGCVILPGGLAMVVFGLMAIGMLLRLRRALTEQAASARTTWAAANDGNRGDILRGLEK